MEGDLSQRGHRWEQMLQAHGFPPRICHVLQLLPGKDGKRNKARAIRDPNAGSPGRFPVQPIQPNSEALSVT